jgi:hypothetical protein
MYTDHEQHNVPERHDAHDHHDVSERHDVHDHHGVPERHDTHEHPTRRSVLRALGAVGATAGFAGCLGGGAPAATDSSSTASGSTPTATPTVTPTPAEASAGGAAVDCERLPTALSGYAGDVPFRFAFDAPAAPAYRSVVRDNPVTHLVEFYRDRVAGDPYSWDYYLSVEQSVETYAETRADGYRDATLVDPITFDGVEIPVTHAPITEDQDRWILGLPSENGGVHVVSVQSSILPGQLDCHETVRGVATAVIQSIRPM